MGKERVANFFRKLRNGAKENVPYFIIIALLFLLLLAYLFNRIFITVHAGENGVLYKRLSGGTVIDTVYGEGLQIVAPWNVMEVYNVRIQEFSEEIDVLCSDGLLIKINASIRFRPTRSLLGVLHKHHGPDYVKNYILPELGSSMRKVIGQVTPSMLYSARRDSIEEEAFKHLNNELREIDEDVNIEWPHTRDRGGIVTLKWANELHMIENIESEELRTRVRQIGLMSLVDSLSAAKDSLKFEYEKTKGTYEKVQYLLDSLVVTTFQQSGFMEEIDDAHELLAQFGSEYAGMAAYIDSVTHDYRKMQLEYENIRKALDDVFVHYDALYVLIDIHDILIKNIELPLTIQEAIQAKLQQEQIAQEFDFRLVRERKEAMRKRIEAQGIKAFQDTISKEGIQENYLRWKAIEATLELAKSENAKIVVIGAGKEGLPIILGNIDK